MSRRILRRRVPALLLSAAVIATTAGSSRAEPDLVVADVTLIDGTGAPARGGMSVLVRDGRIVAIGPRASLRPRRGATTIDGRGGYLLPGFVDAHAHLPFGPVTSEQGQMRFSYDDSASQAMAREFVRFGVTTVRSPAGDFAETRALREAIRRGDVSGPRIVSAGPIIDGAPSPLSVSVTTPEAARAEVRRQVAQGVDFVKLYNWLPPAVVAAAVDEAHRHGVAVTGHLLVTNWLEAAEVGIDALEHITPLSPSLIEPARRAEFSSRMIASPTGFMLDWFNFADLDGPLLQATVAALAKRRVVVTPTLTTFAAMVNARDPAVRESADADRIPPVLRASYASSDFTVGWDREQFGRAQRAWPRVQEWVRRLHAAGVPLAVGSDTPMPWVPAGASLHDEMRLLVEAGVPSIEVLVGATRTGARLARVDSLVGTIEVGKVADLVLLEADPIADIRNTRSIRWVMMGGRLESPAPSVAPWAAGDIAPDVERTIRALLDRLIAAVRAQDGGRMASAYVLEEPIEFSSHGMLMSSRAALVAFYGGWDSTRARGTFAEFRDIRMRPLGPDAVLVHAMLRLARGTPTGTGADTLSGGWTGVFERRAGRWGLSHEHESFTITGRRP